MLFRSYTLSIVLLVSPVVGVSPASAVAIVGQSLFAGGEVTGETTVNDFTIDTNIGDGSVSAGVPSYSDALGNTGSASGSAAAALTSTSITLTAAGSAGGTVGYPPDGSYTELSASGAGVSEVVFRVDVATPYSFLFGNGIGSSAGYPTIQLSEENLGLVWRVRGIFAGSSFSFLELDPGVGCASASVATCASLLTVLDPGVYTARVGAFSGVTRYQDVFSCQAFCGGSVTGRLILDLPVVVPEPGTAALVAIGLPALAVRRRARRRT